MQDVTKLVTAFLSSFLWNETEEKQQHYLLPLATARGLSSATTAVAKLHHKPNCNEGTSLNMSCTKGCLYGEARGNPLCMNSPLSTLILGKLPSKYSLQQSYSELHYFFVVDCCTCFRRFLAVCCDTLHTLYTLYTCKYSHATFCSCEYMKQRT